jgi:hypothetical protein
LKEESVFWRGGKPGAAQKAAAAPAAEALEPAVRAACESLGLRTDRFVASLGGYGSWLVQFDRDARPHRIVWNGRSRTMVLQAALRQGGWEDLRECEAETQDEAGFRAAIGTLLTAASATGA